MIVDTSALLAILLREKERAALIAAMTRGFPATMSAGSFVELHAVLTRRFLGRLDDDAEELIPGLGITIAPVTAAQAIIGRDAYRRYGIESGHPARLNFGDCFAYALSKDRGEPLLFKGDDFARTDVVAALP